MDDVEENTFEPEPEEAPAASIFLKKDPEADARLELARTVLRQAQEAIGNALRLIEGTLSREEGKAVTSRLITAKQESERVLDDISGSRIIEGVFDGQGMVGSDGNAYAVPPNYASKSRLVEGDMLKLTIAADGSFRFKQIGPIERRRLVGKLAYDATSGLHVVLCGEQIYKVLTASVTFFHGEPGDEVVILVPKSTPSVWAAVENVVRK